MVFEALVVELLNKFLKEYVENLDTSQLKIGIWGGDVVLNDLKIKTTAFDDLNLPIRVKWGKLGKLALKIPWKNLYSSQVVVDIEELLIVLIPNTELNYDPVKEEKWENDRKQARLRAVEEVRKRGTELENTKQGDGFVEKLVTQIIKNIQVVIRNIHVRYEDKTTIPNSPFAVGITMSNLSATTSIDSTFGKANENSNFICKMVHLDGLAIYWNSQSLMLSDMDVVTLSQTLLEGVPEIDNKPNDYLYLFGPLSASAFLKLNPKPECDGSNFKIPKIFVKIHLKEIELAVTRSQFTDFILFMQDYQRLAAASKYRKYKPFGIPIIGHAKQWWIFAYNCIVEDIRRRKREWSWENIYQHRVMCKRYSELYEIKLGSKKIPPSVGDELINLEKKLNVFNILLLREQAYVQVERNNSVKISNSEGWFSGWFSYGNSNKQHTNESDIVKKIESVMTTSEKEKLYKAIGYDENAPPSNFPEDFVEFQFLFSLDEIRATIYDDELTMLTIMTLSIKTVEMDFDQRPAAFAMKFGMTIGSFQILGKRGNDNEIPELVTSNCLESERLVEILYETKPLNSSCDKRIIVNARPLRIIYHADTLNRVRDIFDTRTTEDVSIASVTSASLPAFQRITALGLQYAIERKSVIEVKVKIMPSYIIIPYGGFYEHKKDMLVIMLGKFSVETEDNEQKDLSVKKLYLEGTTEQEIFSTVLSASYTKFKCELTGVQVLLQLKGEDWVQASNIQGKSALRLLESTDLVVIIKKSLVTDDARIPKMICEGKLPSLTFNFSEERLIAFAALICSIPINAEERETILKKTISMSRWSIQSIGMQLENKLAYKQIELLPSVPVRYVQGIDYVVHFEMNELVINVTKSKLESKSRRKETYPIRGEDKFLVLRVVKLEAELTGKTFESINLLKLGGIDFQQFYKNKSIPFVTTKGLQHDFYLFVVEFIHVDLMAPDFRTIRGSIINRLTLNVTPLNVVFNREALLALLAFWTHLEVRLENVKQNSLNLRVATAGKLKELPGDNFTEGISEKKILPKGKKFRKKINKKEVIDFFLDASLEEINFNVEFEGQGLTEFTIQGGSIEITNRKSYTNLDFKLKKISLLDLNPKTIHSRIIESLEQQTLSARITLFNSEYYGSGSSVDISVEAEVGGIRCIFLSVFFTRVIIFLNAFQVQVQSIKEGAAVAAERAKKNVIKAYQNTSKICVNIKITRKLIFPMPTTEDANKQLGNVLAKLYSAGNLAASIVKSSAPLLVIPRKCASNEVLMVDLGVLTVKNRITELNHRLEGQDTVNRPLVDTMKFHLQNLKFSSCLLRQDGKTQENEKAFLIPVSFELTIKRNLSISWFKMIPELEIIARLATVHVTLTHTDLCNIANILRDNVKEGENQDVKTPSASLDQKSNKVKRDEHQQRHNLTALEEDDIHTEGNEEFHTVTKFLFFMDSFIFDALTETTKRDTSVTKNCGLARFVLETISIKGRQFSNGSIDTSILLVSCILDDTRPGKLGRLTRLMERSDTANTERDAETNMVKSMVEMLYKRKGFDAFVDIRVYKFTLILSMDFLHKLREFFLINNDFESGNTDVYDTSKTLRPIENISKLTKGDDKEYREMEERPPTFTINLRLEKPDIIIVENMDSIDTDALIFHTEIVMKYRFAGIRQIISGTLADIELYSCCFNPSKRQHTLSQVIKPFTISVAGSTPLEQGLHIDICLTEICISINPNTVELLSKCYEALLFNPLEDDDNLKAKNYSSLWDVQSFSTEDYWFLKTEQGEDALLTCASSSSDTLSVGKSAVDEICLLAVPSIIILVEGLTGKQSKPMFLLQMGFQLQAYNWSTKLAVSSSLTLQLHYYNKVVTAWEPLIEPVEVPEDREKKIKHSYSPWELNCSISTGDEGYLDTVEPPKMSVNISCTDILPITLTKTALEVLNNAVNMYTSAITKGIVKKVADLPPFIVKNETGLVAELLLEKSNLQICKAISAEYNTVKLDSNTEVELQATISRSELHSWSALDENRGFRLFIRFPISKSAPLEVPLNFTSKRYYPLSLGEFAREEVWGLVADVSMKDNTTTLCLRSILQITNYFCEQINIHSLSENGKEAEFVGAVEGNSTFSLPFHSVYNSGKKLFFSVKGYYLSMQPFAWENIKRDSNVSMLLQCNTRTPETNDPFFIQAIGEIEEIYFSSTSRKTNASVSYAIHLQPTIKIMNSLPVDLILCFQGSSQEKYLKPGNTAQITNAEPGSSSLTLRIEYLEKEWSSKETVPENPEEFFILKFTSYTGLSPETLNLGVHCTFIRKTAVYTIYSPYFMVNKTGHLLSYRFEGSQSVFYHPQDLNVPIMFSPSYRKFFSKKSAYLQIERSDWSDKFPVDVAGSGGTIECEDSSTNIVYRVSVSISLSFNSLTKVVMFTPYFVFINETDYIIEYCECDVSNNSWLEVEENSCVPFWPISREKNKTVQLRPKGSKCTTPPFEYSSTDSCLLRLKNEYGGIFVNIQATQSGTYITFHSYEAGQAPALIINHSDKTITLYEIDTDFGVTVKPYQKVMHTWVEPTGKRKLTLMNPKHRKDEINLEQDATGKIFTAKGEAVKYVTFLDGTQRILLFTDDVGLWSSITNFIKSTTSGIELICDIQGIGISLVNDINRTEILYFSFVSSGIMWETRKLGKSRYKRMKEDDMAAIEEAYIKYQNESELNEYINPIVDVTDKMRVNFEAMKIIQPNSRELELKRTFEPGVWLAYRVMEDHIMINFKANKIQVDNQLHECIFPVILSPVPPPKTVATLYQGTKPFFELSIVKRANTSGLEQFKYFEILVQEFHVKIDVGFLQQFWLFLATERISEEEQKMHFLKDLEFAEKPLMSHIEIVSSNEQKNFYEYLHLSPLKIHFSFSLAGNIDTGSLPPAFSVMIQSVGVTLTDIHDVIFRLSYFERKCIFLTKSQLQNEVISHYYGQTVRQAYVLLLGLDVIGNPYGLIVGIGEGVEAFFYEPFQGIVHGPSEFATGVAIGCKSLFGRTVGSTAGTLGKLTETLGKGLAVLSLDREYQLQRMEAHNQHENIQASMARGGRGLVMGVFEGVTGIVKKPLEGAKEEGVGGFFKGVGKGMMGLVTRPVTGVVDFASTSLNAVKRATGPSFENKRQRPPRFFRHEQLVLPYNIYEALGNSIFHATCRRKYCSSDKYEHHIQLREKEIAILTNKRMILAELNELFGIWQEHMAITWKSMPDRPHCHIRGVAITLPPKGGAYKKKKFDVKVLLIQDADVKTEVCKKMTELYRLAREADL